MTTASTPFENRVKPCPTSALVLKLHGGSFSPRPVYPATADISAGSRDVSFMRPSSLVFHVTQRLLYTKWRDPGEEPKRHLFGRRRCGGANSNQFTNAWQPLRRRPIGPTRTASSKIVSLAAAAVIFVEPGKSERTRDVGRQALGGKRFEYLMALLVFIRAAHFWTVAHPGLEIEDDMRTLISEQKELARLLLQDPDLPLGQA
jgi:hypothetical protein